MSWHRHIEDRPNLSGVPLVMLTSLNTADTVNGGPTPGIVDRLTKPVRQSQLLDAILSATARRGGEQAATGAQSPETTASKAASSFNAQTPRHNRPAHGCCWPRTTK